MNDRIAIYMLDVGQGDSTIVRLPDDRVVIFDCADDHVLSTILSNWKTPAIAGFVISHLDQDHIAGALGFLKNWTNPIQAVYLGVDRDITGAHDDAKRAKALVDFAIDQGGDAGTLSPRAPLRRASQRRFELVSNERDPRPLAHGADWSVTLLAPAHAQNIRREREGEWEDANRYSSVLRVQAGASAMLIGGDAPLLTWSELPAEELPAVAFRIPHHGGALDDGGTP